MSGTPSTASSTQLLDVVLDAAGGLDQWRTHSFLSAHLSQGGGIWAVKDQAGVLDDVRIDIALHQEWVSHHPFGAPGLRSSFTPQRVKIHDDNGSAVESLEKPRASFAGHGFNTPWSRLQLAYFVGTAMWTYLTQPFCFTLPEFRTKELSPWEDDDRTLRRLQVDWPAYLATHSTRQTLYFDESGRLARHDYEVEIVANAPAAHLFDKFVTVDGITMPTSHKILGRDAQNRIDDSSVIVSIDIDDIAFTQP
jgi:hypothetical protein